MPAKKAPAKKTPARRAAPAKKKVASRSMSKRPVSKTTTKMNKTIAYENLWEDDLQSQYPAMKKNNFLSLIVLGLGTLLVIVGIYIQVTKEEPATTTTKTGSVATVGTGTAATTGTPANNSGQTTPTTQSTFPVDSQNIVETFYNYFNQDQFDQISSLYDNNFNTVPGLRTYFSPTRLQRWKENIVGDLKVDDVTAVIDHPLVQKNSNAMVVQYKTMYTLKQDGKNYEETWFAYVLRGNGTVKLNGFECQENCAASPFFHLR